MTTVVMPETTMIEISTELKEQLDSLRKEGTYEDIIEDLLFEMGILTPRLLKEHKEAVERMDKGEYVTLEELEKELE